MRHFKIQNSGLIRIRLTIHRQNQFLNVCVRYCDIILRFIIRRGDDFDGYRELALAGRDGNCITGVEVIVFPIITARVTRHRADRFTDTHLASTRIECGSADVLTARSSDRFICNDNVAEILNVVKRFCRQPAGIIEVDAGRMVVCTVKLVHFPVVHDVEIALKLLDDLAHGELSGNAAPDIVICIAAIQHHERIRMAQHPCERVHGLFREDIAGVTRRYLIASQIDDRIRAGIVIADNRTVLRMLKAVSRFTLHVVRRSKDRTVLIMPRNGQILVVVSGRCMKPRFTDVEARHTTIMIFQIIVIVRQQHRPHVVRRITVIRRRAPCQIGLRRFIRQNIDMTNKLADQAVAFIRAKDVGNPVPRATKGVFQNILHLHSSVFEEVSEEVVAVVVIRSRIIHFHEHAGLCRDIQKVPDSSSIRFCFGDFGFFSCVSIERIIHCWFFGRLFFLHSRLFTGDDEHQQRTGFAIRIVKPEDIRHLVCLLISHRDFGKHISMDIARQDFTI